LPLGNVLTLGGRADWVNSRFGVKVLQPYDETKQQSMLAAANAVVPQNMLVRGSQNHGQRGLLEGGLAEGTGGKEEMGGR
jgi:hypothetical protein